MYAVTTAYLVSPNWPYTPTHCSYTYINLVVGTSVFSTSTLWGLFSFFYSLFFARTKTQINEYVTFFPLDVFERIFHFCSLVAFCSLAWFRLCAFALLLRAKSFCKKKKIKEFKTALIISFALLLAKTLYDSLKALLKHFSMSNKSIELLNNTLLSFGN